MFTSTISPLAVPKCIVDLYHGWRACRSDNQNLGSCARWLRGPLPSLPTTALAALLAARELHLPKGSDPYFSDNLAHLPDINATGANYYTLTWERQVPVEQLAGECEAQSADRAWLRLEGVNYRAARATLGGVPLPTPPPGMFIRHRYDVSAGGAFSITISPPDHYGGTECGVGPCGQGGDHALAQDVTAQAMLGWDWARPIPDRSTGFFGSVQLELTGNVTIENAALLTRALSCGCARCVPCGLRAEHAELLLVLTLENHAAEAVEVMLDAAVREPDPTAGGMASNSGGLRHIIRLGKRSSRELRLPLNATDVPLWWPHNAGTLDGKLGPSLLDVIVQARIRGKLSHADLFRVGVRTAEAYIDRRTGGRAFRVNGRKIFLLGGNWITPDLMLRYSADKERYCDEVLLHKQAGINLLRVWGGGVSERGPFYECATELGLFVFQEFWMSGDNNGRWAGSYSWPLDMSAYLANAEDTVRRLRRFAALLFWGGGNELYPQSLSPPSALQDIVRREDPGRFYIASSMDGGILGANMTEHSDEYALAVKDGPYGMLMPGEFAQRNPGLAANLTISFQPEVGSTSAPSYSGLLRFMTASEAERFPARGDVGGPGPVWDFHTYEGWSTANGSGPGLYYDHVYAYGEPVNASEWAAAAALASYAQYQALVESFQARLFEWYAAVCIWKTQSPWPSLRGFLYDWWLEPTGTFYGVQAAAASDVHVQLDRGDWGVRVVNKRVAATLPPASISADWFALDGTRVATKVLRSPRVPASTARAADGVIEWPAVWPTGTVGFLRLTLRTSQRPDVEQGPGKTRHYGGEDAVVVSWYWLAPGPAPDYSLLGAARHGQKARLNMRVLRCSCADGKVRATVELQVPQSTPELVFYPQLGFSLPHVGGTLASLQGGDRAVVLLPGDTPSVRTVDARVKALPGVPRVVAQSWNAPQVEAVCACERQEVFI